MRVISNVNVIEDNGIFDHTIIANITLLEDHGVLYHTVDNTSAGYQAVTHLRTGVVFCGRQIIHLGIYIRILLEEVISHIRFQEVHICAVVILHRCDISPVILDLISVDSLQILVTDQNISYEIITVFLSTLLDHLDQQSASYHIDTTGNGVGLGLQRLFLELFDTALLVHADRTETLYIRTSLHVTADHRDIGFLLDMVFQYLIVIQLVYTVAGSDHYIRLMAVLQEIQILVDRICGSSVPVAVLCCHSRSEHI